MLTFAHSPDADDLALWWAMIEDLPGVRDGLAFEFVPSDIESLNRRAIESGDLDVTALSTRALAEAADRYAVAPCGASIGRSYGPKVVCRHDAPIACHGCLSNPRLCIAVPGLRTTACLTLSLLLGLGPSARGPRLVPVPFERVTDEVAAGRYDAGLVIHEAQLSFADQGLRLVIDLGQWWTERTGTPLPLGLTGVRSDLDARHGPGTTLRLLGVMRRSIRRALDDREGVLGFVRERRPSADPARTRQFLDLYANADSLDMGERGRAGIRRLLADGATAGLCPAPRSILFL